MLLSHGSGSFGHVAAAKYGVHKGFAEAMAAMCPSGALVEPDAKSFTAYRDKYAAFRRLAETLSTLPAGR